MKKLPIGIQTFSEIIEDCYIYVDKTDIALNLINSGKYYFLSRPRRFGKSLFLSTLKSIFEGKKELFEGLYIYDKYDFKPYPVISFSWGSGIINSDDSFQSVVDRNIELIEMDLDVKCDTTKNPKRCLEELITNIYKKYNQRVVILIDEYDKPILDNIENRDMAVYMRDKIRDIYSILKDNDRYIRFVFITGVSKFSKVSLFSGLNNLNDITLNSKYATICGYTQNDIETTFAEHLKGQDFDKIKKWYNGYKWLGEGVYNPFDILLFISNDYIYDNYWFGTGTPTFLMKILEKNNYFLPSFENIVRDRKMLDSFDVDYIELETLMWQTGYLTIDRVINLYDELRYNLVIPNHEVKISIFGFISDFLTQKSSVEYRDKIKISLYEENLPNLQKSLISLYASIPYNNFTHNRMFEMEGYYVSLFYAYIKALGVDIIAEDVTNKGRIDITIILPNIIYIIEFKTDGKEALKQIKEKKYYEKYLDSDKKIYLLGIEFDIEKRNIDNFEFELL